MRITKLDWNLDQQIVSIDGNVERSPGLHVSTVIKALETRYGRLKGRKDLGDDNEAKWRPYRLAGFLIERAFREILPKNLTKVGELCMDNIYMTPDYFDPDDWVLEEWKCTWRSSGDDLEYLEENFISWMMQIMAYCRTMCTLRARLRVFWINGNYKPRVPDMAAYELEFTQQELDVNWSAIVNYAKAEGWL